MSAYTTQMAELQANATEIIRSTKLNIYRKIYKEAPISRSLAFKDKVVKDNTFHRRLFHDQHAGVDVPLSIFMCAIN